MPPAKLRSPLTFAEQLMAKRAEVFKGKIDDDKILKNEPNGQLASSEFTKDQYTKKIYHPENKVIGE